MGLLAYLLVSFAIFVTAYFTVGRWLRRLFRLDTRENTPAHTQRDGVDFEPHRTSQLLPQHLSAIAAAGPIVGPILAGAYFGWGPAWIWIVVGAIFVGGIHDFTALIASVRHRGRSIGVIVREYMNPRAYVLFLFFVWSALVYVIIAFTDVTAGTFVQAANEAGGDAPGPSVATSSILYLLLAVAMGLVLKFTKLGHNKAKAIFIPLVFLAIVAGPYLPIDLTGFKEPLSGQQLWSYLLLGYCFIAALVPMWALLQPRGELGGYFLYIIMGVSVVGIIVGAFGGDLAIQQPFFKGWHPEATPGPLFPILFITVACGACSGFHSIIASGTTSKQLDRESDALPVAYGSMLIEGLLACTSLAALMVLKQYTLKPDAIYAQGVAAFGGEIAKPFAGAHMATIIPLLYKFALLSFATFVFDTLDACTRLARYVLMELLGWKTRRQAAIATLLSLALPAIVASIPMVSLDGKPMPVWKVFWGIFGSSNQLLAALTLLGVTVWLARRRMAWWLTIGPTAFMLFMTIWSLLLNVGPYVAKVKSGADLALIVHMQFVITILLVVLAVWLVVEAVLIWLAHLRHRDEDADPVPTVELAGL